MTQGINPGAPAISGDSMPSVSPREPGRLFASRGFLMASIVLLLAAVGLNTSISYLQLHFKKAPVPMRGTFVEKIPEILGKWVQVAREDTLEADMLSALATDQYLFCSYLNSSKLGKTPEAIRKEFAGKSMKEQKALLTRYRQQEASAVLTVGLTYYTGKADTVAHIPERCYIGDGFDPRELKTEKWGLGRDLDVRYITFESQTTANAPPCNVAYFFHVNGKYTCDSLEVRAELQNLRNRYGYYAKVETMCVHPDREVAARAIQDFLAQVLPKVEAVLPIWSEYRSR